MIELGCSGCESQRRKILEIKIENDKLRKGNEILRKMGEFYADTENWNPNDDDMSASEDYAAFEIDDDGDIGYLGGQVARQALKEYAEIMGDL